jgi:hypothetical protein
MLGVGYKFGNKYPCFYRWEPTADSTIKLNIPHL